MKRSSCLSALLVGLSLTTASLALAAPDDGAPAKKPAALRQAKGKTKGKQPAVQTVQPMDPAPEGAGTPPATPPPTAPAEPAAPAAEPAPAPATAPATEPAAEPSTPAISIGSANGPPGADVPGAAAEDPKKPAKARPWAGSAVFATTSMTTATVFKGQTQYNNPTADMSIWLQPRFAINEAFQLRGLLVYSYEFTNADDTNTKNEPRFSDTTLQLFYRKIPEIPKTGIKPAVALNATLPSSPEARARTLVFSPGATLQLAKNFEHVLGGTVDIISTGVYSHPIYRSTTPQIRGSRPYAFQCVSGDSCQDQLSGTFNTSDAVGYSLLVTAAWGKWSPAIFYRGTSSWAYQGSEVKNPVDGTTLTSATTDPTHTRQKSYFSVWLDYDVNSWLTAEVGYWLDRSTVLGEDGKRANPFFDRYQDMRVYLGASFSIDNIMKQLEGGPTEAGIVRAQNKNGPIGHF